MNQGRLAIHNRIKRTEETMKSFSGSQISFQFRRSILRIVTGVICLFVFTSPAFAWPRGQRIIERRESRLLRLDNRSELRWQRLEDTAASINSPNRLSPGMVRRLRRQGLSEDEIATFSAGKPPAAVNNNVGKSYTPGKGTGVKHLSTLPPNQFNAEALKALPPSENRVVKTDQKPREVVQSSATDPESVLVLPPSSTSSATIGPQFPGLLKGSSQSPETDVSPPVVTHEPIQLLPPPTPK